MLNHKQNTAFTLPSLCYNYHLNFSSTTCNVRPLILGTVTHNKHLCWSVEELRAHSMQHLNLLFLWIFWSNIHYISPPAQNNFSFSDTLSLTMKILLVDLCPWVPDQWGCHCFGISGLSVFCLGGFKLCFGVLGDDLLVRSGG